MKDTYRHVALAFAVLLTLSNFASAQTNTFPSSGNAGIGTTSPSNKLDINAVGGTDTGISFRDSGNSGYQTFAMKIGQYNGGTTIFQTVNSTNFRLQAGASSTNGFFMDTSGNIGIGTTSPNSWDSVARLALLNSLTGNAIDLAGNGFSRLNLRDTSQATDQKNWEFLNMNGGLTISRINDSQTTRTSYFNLSNAGTFGLGMSPASTVRLDVQGTTSDSSAYAMRASNSSSTVLMSVRNDGNVGIGTTATSKLTVAGTVESTSGGFKFPDGTVQTSAAVGSGSSQWTTIGNNINYSSGNVGIGTTSPGAKLSFGDLNDGRNTADGITWYNPSPTAYGIYRSSGAWIAPNYQQLTLAWSTGLVLDGGTAYGRSGTVLQPSGGNVGIGTTAPTSKLHVDANNTTTGEIASYFLTGTFPNIRGSVLHAGNGGGYLSAGGLQLVAQGAANATSGSGDINFLTSTANSANNSTDATLALRMKIKYDGNVGIGTTSPTSHLHLFGNSQQVDIQSSTSTAPVWQRLYNGSGIAYIGVEGSASGAFQTGSTPYAAIIGSGASGVPLQFSTAGTVRTTIDSSGNVGIGTAGPGYKLDVQGGQVNASGGLCINGDCKTGWSQVASQWANNGSGINYSSGNVGIGTTNPANGKLQVTTTGGASVSGGGASLAYFQSTSSFGGLSLGAPASSNTFIEMLEGPTKKAGFNWDASGATLGIQSGGDFQFQLPNGTGPLMTVKSSGKVGIGTPSPSEKLDIVGGNINVTSSGGVGGNITATGTINAKYQDVAEWVPSSEQLSAGTVVVLDSTKSNQVTSSSTAYDTRVAGVVSAQPGIALGEKSEGKVLVATTGRVRVKVDATKVPIHVGDLLVTSDIPGVAMKSEPMEINGRKFHQPGTLIGKALEPLNNGKGEILVLLSLQ